MSHRTDEEFEAIIHNEIHPGQAPVAESDEAKHLREELVPAHVDELGHDQGVDAEN
jgi:hypothetical protein